MKKIKDQIEKKVFETPFIDTHEHLIDEYERLACIEPIIPCDDWALLLNHYFSFDLISSGISKNQIDNLFSKNVTPINKWRILKEYWPYLKNTTSGIVFRQDKDREAPRQSGMLSDERYFGDSAGTER